MTVWYEIPQNCTYRIGNKPWQTYIGEAWTGDGPAIVIWKQLGDEERWSEPMILDARYAPGYIVSQALAIAGADETAAKASMFRDDRPRTPSGATSMNSCSGPGSIHLYSDPNTGPWPPSPYPYFQPGGPYPYYPSWWCSPTTSTWHGAR